MGSTDEQLLEWAANNNRVIITHDVQTMPGHAVVRMTNRLLMPGLIIVPNKLELSRTSDDLQIIIDCAVESDLTYRIYFLPL